MEHTLIFDRKKLLEALRCVGTSVDKKGVILQQFKCVRLTMVKGKRVLLRTTSQSSSCDYMLNDPLGDDAPENMDCAVEYTKLYYLVSKSKKTSIEVKWDDESGRFVILHEGRSTLDTVPVTNFSTLPGGDITPLIEKLDPKELIEAWAATNFTIAVDLTRYDLRGILYDGNWVTSTGTYISVYKASEEHPVLDTPLLIVPALESFVKLISGPTLKIDKLEARRRGESHLVLVVHTPTGKMRFMVVLSAYKFPNWRHAIKMLRERCVNQFKVSRTELMEALNRVAIFLDKSRHIILDLEQESRTLKITVQKTRSAENTVETISLAEHEDEVIGQTSFRANVGYDILWNITNENREDHLLVNYINGSTPLLITTGNKEYIVATMVEVVR